MNSLGLSFEFDLKHFENAKKNDCFWIVFQKIFLYDKNIAYFNY